jgi:predicted unusual protein kinase regulating ubiquinone biosynthesis (AarF/ABC1/UbiB family)
VLIELGTLSPEADREVMANVMELAIADARGEDIEQYRVQQIVEQVEDTIYEFPLRLPPNLALVLRVATVVEGVCVTLDPEFDFIDVATDYLREEGYVEASIREFLTDRADEVNDAARSALRTPPKLEDTLDRINRGDLEVEATVADEESVFDQLAVRLVLGLLLTGTVLAAAILYAFATPISAVAPAAGAALLLGLLYRSFREQSGISATPQFTRQEMRKRQEEP